MAKKKNAEIEPVAVQTDWQGKTSICAARNGTNFQPSNYADSIGTNPTSSYRWVV